MSSEMIGRKYGKLTVTAIHGRYADCVCDCGNTATVSYHKLAVGHTKSCGCITVAEDLTRQVFGQLTALCPAPKRAKNRGLVWTCKCSCGNTKDIEAHSLKRGNTKSCGCTQFTKPKSQLTLGHREQKAKEALLRNYIASAKVRGIEFKLADSEFYSLTKEPCTYCGQPPSQLYHYNKEKIGSYRYTGIDREDPQKGYTLGNCVPCCKTCNYSKGKLSAAAYIEHCSKVAVFAGVTT